MAKLITPAGALAVARRPRLWLTAALVALRLSPPGWWRRRPWLPRPDDRYLAFRLETAYGSPTHPPEPDDLVAYLEWVRDRGQADRSHPHR